MAILRDLESEIELAFITYLGTSTDITGLAGTPKRWRDASSVATYPRVLVHCSPVGDAPEQPNGDLYVANVEIGVQTDTVRDKNQAVLLQLMGAARDKLKASGLVASLNAVAGNNVDFLERGITIGSGEHQVDDDEVTQMSLTLTCQCTRIIA